MQIANIISKIKNQLKPNIEVCNECGRNMSWKSGLFINRVIDFDGYKTRKEMDKLFPQGDYICRKREKKLSR